MNKRILRGFKKYYVKLFSSQSVRPCRLKGGCRDFKIEMISEAHRLGILQTPDPSPTPLTELVCWMGMSKNTLKTKLLFDTRNSSINLVDEVLTKYSHKKLKSCLADPSFGKLFKYFIDTSLGEFLASCPKGKEKLYSERAMEIFHNLNLVD